MFDKTVFLVEKSSSEDATEIHRFNKYIVCGLSGSVANFSKNAAAYECISSVRVVELVKRTFCPSDWGRLTSFRFGISLVVGIADIGNSVQLNCLYGINVSSNSRIWFCGVLLLFSVRASHAVGTCKEFRALVSLNVFFDRTGSEVRFVRGVILWENCDWN